MTKRAPRKSKQSLTAEEKRNLNFGGANGLSKQGNVQKPADEVRAENVQLRLKISSYEQGAQCRCCGKIMPKNKFYRCSDTLVVTGVTPICKKCAENIACRVDATTGEFQGSTRESLIVALKYLDKPFLQTVYESAIKESDKRASMGQDQDPAKAYFKTISMTQYAGLTYADSDFFKTKVVYSEDIVANAAKVNTSDGKLVYDAKDQWSRDREDVIKLLHYDPFEREANEDKPFLYSQLVGMLDESEDANSDMMRVSSCISIVRDFLQMDKIDNAIAGLMGNYSDMTSSAGMIKSLQDSKQKLSKTIVDLAAESCISLKHTKNSKKGENTWTGKLKRLKDVDLRDGEINGFDLGTCKGMEQVAQISSDAIFRTLHLDESEYTEMLSDQREKILSLNTENKSYKESLRLVLRENLDLRDVLKQNDMLDESKLMSLDDVLVTYKDENEDEPEGSEDNNYNVVSENEDEDGKYVVDLSKDTPDDMQEFDKESETVRQLHKDSKFSLPKEPKKHAMKKSTRKRGDSDD